MPDFDHQPYHFAEAAFDVIGHVIPQSAGQMSHGGYYWPPPFKRSNGSFPKSGAPNMDPKIVGSLIYKDQNKTLNFWKLPYHTHQSHINTLARMNFSQKPQRLERLYTNQQNKQNKQTHKYNILSYNVLSYTIDYGIFYTA